MDKKKPDILTIIMVLCLTLGVAVFFYPKVSDLIVSRKIEKAQEEFDRKNNEISEERRKARIEELKRKNEEIAENYAGVEDPFYLGKKEGTSTIYGTDKGKMESIGSIMVPHLNINISIFEGTDDEVLKYGAGHMEKSSYPIGGMNSHSVITAHTGFSSAKFFSELINIKIGEKFYVKSIDGMMAYQVVEINTVLPNELQHLAIQEGRDLVTLMTCTPEGINTHRLLVLGERIDYTPEVEEEFEEAKEESDKDRKYNKYKIIFGILISLLIIILLVLAVRRREKDA